MKSSIETRSTSQRVAEIDQVVFKQYLTQLNDLPAIKPENSLEQIISNVRVNKVSKIVYDSEEDNLEKLSSVFSAMSNHSSTIFILVQSDGSQADIYLGTRSDSLELSHLAIETFGRSLEANFAGIELEELYADDVREIAGHITSENIQHIACVSGIPSQKDSESQFVQGIEKMIDGMRGKAFSAIMLATPVSLEELETMEAGYQELYTALSLVETQQATVSTSQSQTIGVTIGESVSSALSKTVSTSKSESHGTSKSHTEGTSSSTTKTDTSSKNMISLGLTKYFGGKTSHSSSTTSSTTSSDTTGETHTKTTGETNSSGKTDTDTSSTTQSDSTTIQTGNSIQVTLKNRKIIDVLELIEEQLARLRECRNQGMWKYGVYFLDSLKSTTQLGADLFAGIMRGQTTGVEHSATLTWSRDAMRDDFDTVCRHLSCFSHPSFDTSKKYSFNSATPTALVSTTELAVGMSLPQKSLPGIPVFESVEFGRSVSSYEKSPERMIDVGVVQHLGRNYPEHPVRLDVDSLSAHMFVTGSTGAGKSNAIYSIVHSLWKSEKVPFLIIEPAKGEYKDVFGGYLTVSVFGTNPSLTSLLQVNPFSFPEGIHVTEHIDRLLEILNAVWPMYAAMPAILKASIEKAYESVGWNILTSINQYGLVFPDFHDLSRVLPEVIEKSAYSDEIKGNYAGALVTRVDSLTNGYYRSIFRKEELESSVLFDAPCIVDLSRVGSSETKSLLMGILFMKLQEYRLSKSGGSNASLKHITVMEEAHNLMRRTSFDQNAEGANLQGKAVEMIANAIAEMRTSGEGFIISDQAPSLLDQSVIRNTNTKIILRLPDWEDRQLVGKAANLKENQIEELARLRKGCAAVYQNDWQEALLCQFGKFPDEHIKPFEFNVGEGNASSGINSRALYRAKLVATFLAQEGLESIEVPSDWAVAAQAYYPKQASKILNKQSLTSSDFRQLIEFSNILDDLPKTKSHELWFRSLLELTYEKVREVEGVEINGNALVQALLDTLVELKPNQESLWREEGVRTEVWAKALI